MREFLTGLADEETGFERRKRLQSVEIARQLLSADDLALSVQVLQEFYVQAARALGGRLILSEDLRDGQSYRGVKVRNPFARRLQAPAGQTRMGHVPRARTSPNGQLTVSMAR